MAEARQIDGLPVEPWSEQRGQIGEIGRRTTQPMDVQSRFGWRFVGRRYRSDVEACSIDRDGLAGIGRPVRVRR